MQVALEARNSAWLTCDGRERFEMKPGDTILCRYSQFPVPAVMPKRNEFGDSDGWLQSLKFALNWNVIQLQKNKIRETLEEEGGEDSSSPTVTKRVKL